MNTQHATYLIGFKNNIAKHIFQDSNELKKIIEIAQIQGNNIDINSVKQLNSFDRFVKIKDMPEWLLLLMSREVERITTALQMERNEMI